MDPRPNGRDRGTRWVYEAAVSRDDEMRQLARRVVEAFCARSGDGWYLVWAALDAVDVEAALDRRSAF